MQKIDLSSYKYIHFIGIGGISMSGLAEILFLKGIKVTGSDVSNSDIISHLADIGIEVFIPHNKNSIRDNIDLVVYTAAIKADNPELVAAKEKNIPVIDRAMLLGAMMEGYGCPICVSGTHGKTSTSSMISEILMCAGVDPTVTVGGVVASINSSFRIGAKDYLVAEACEYFDSFLRFYPKAGVILNVEADHLDYFKTEENVLKSFKGFALNVKPDGVLVVNRGIKGFDELIKGVGCRIVTFGDSKAQGADWYPEDVRFNDKGFSSFNVMQGSQKICTLFLQVIGMHNVMNAVAAFAAAFELGIDKESIIKALSAFRPAKRRYERKGCINGVTVVDDYAHHPTEIKATLEGASKSGHNKIFCVFQPHTYTRTYNLLEEFSTAFDKADEVLLVDIYSAREKDTGIVHSRDLVEKINIYNNNLCKARYFPSFADVEKYLLNKCIPNDLLITMGAGDVYLIGDNILSTKL